MLVSVNNLLDTAFESFLKFGLFFVEKDRKMVHCATVSKDSEWCPRLQIFVKQGFTEA